MNQNKKLCFFILIKIKLYLYSPRISSLAFGKFARRIWQSLVINNLLIAITIAKIAKW